VDGKLFPEALCQPGSQTHEIGRVLGFMVNLGSGPQVWTCPVIREAVDDDAIIFAHMTVIDNNDAADAAGGALLCSLLSSTSTGTVHGSAGRNTTGRGGPGMVALEFVPPETPEVEGVAGDYYYFQCTIPGMDNNGQTSGVVSYEIHERND
jgi:hypothetical protein